MRSALVCLLGAVTWGCNPILGITETSPSDVSCSSSAECLDVTGEWDPSACVEGRCVRLRRGSECPTVLPQGEWLTNLDRTDPDPVVFGILTWLEKNGRSEFIENYELVLNEVTQEVGGLPAPGGKRRPILAVACDGLPDEVEKLDRAIDHLVNELKVPGIIAAMPPEDLEYAFARAGRTNQVFFISVYEADRALVELDDDGLVWQLLSGGEQLAPTYAALLDRTVRHLRKTGELAEGEPVRVALVTADEVKYLSTVSRALTDGILQFNDRAALENSDGHFLALSIPSRPFANEAIDYSSAITELVNFRPHVVIDAATDEVPETIILGLEAAAPELLPFYLLSPWNRQERLVFNLAVAVPKIDLRLAGVNWEAAVDRKLYEGYESRFEAAFKQSPLDTENHYDAAYYLIHAAAAAGFELPLRGSGLAKGMQRLLSGSQTFGVGPSDLLPAYVALEEPGSSIVLDGTMGPPNFDPATGARDLPGSVWCFNYKTGAIDDDVLRLTPEGTLTGTFSCFDFDVP
jgi:hypothetical protein